MKMSVIGRKIAYHQMRKSKIIALLSIVLLSVFVVFLAQMGTGGIGHSQIMPTDIGNETVKNNTLSAPVNEKNMTSYSPVINDTQTSKSTASLSNTSLISTSTNNTNAQENATTIQSPIPQVKITSQLKDQKVPAGVLSISGVSSDTPSSMCDVYVLLNGIKPYQRVIPIGQGSSNYSSKDYSLWKFTFLPTYGLITEGDNKMTAKITCISGTANVTKFNSLNVTGVSPNLANPNTSLAQGAYSLQSSENVTSNNLDQVQSNSTSQLTTITPPANVQQTPVTGGITPNSSQTPQTNYSGISPSSSLLDANQNPNSSVIQQEELVPTNNLSVIGPENEQATDQNESQDKEISEQTQKAVDEFISRVQATVEERLEEALKMRSPFELVTPIPFASEDDR